MTTTPRIDTELTSSRMASTAARRRPSLSPRPTHRPAGHRARPVTPDQPEGEITIGRFPAAGFRHGCDCPRAGSAVRTWDTRCRDDPADEGHPKPRLLQDGRDMFWSLALLVFACIPLAGLVGMCVRSGQMGRRRGAVPVYDAPDALQADADASASQSGCLGCPRAGSPPGRRGGIEVGTHGSGRPAAKARADNHRRLCGTVADVSQPDADKRRRGQVRRLDPYVDVSDGEPRTSAA